MITMPTYRKLWTNSHALSLMYDAVFFIVLVSLSGALLLPAMMNQTALQASVEKKREELVDETLLMFMTSRENTFEYTFAGSQIETILGQDIYLVPIIRDMISKLLGRQMMHKTYADLCTENLVSQLNIFGNHINIFLDDYHTRLVALIDTAISSYLGEKYEYNLTVVWHPIEGLPFGGEIKIGSSPPKQNTYVAKTYVSLPKNTLSDVLDAATSYIHQQIQQCVSELNAIIILIQGTYTPEQLHQALQTFNARLKTIVETTINNILFDGYIFQGKMYNGLLTAVVDYIFENIQRSLASVFDNALKELSDLTKAYTIDINELGIRFDALLIQTVEQIFSITIPPGDDGIQDIGDLTATIKTYLLDQAHLFIDTVLDVYIEQFSTQVLQIINDCIQRYVPAVGFAFSIDDLIVLVDDFFAHQVNVQRAEITFTIWGKKI